MFHVLQMMSTRGATQMPVFGYALGWLCLFALSPFESSAQKTHNLQTSGSFNYLALRTLIIVHNASTDPPNADPPIKRWWAVRTKPNMEEAVAAALRRKGLEVFLPLVEVSDKKSIRLFVPLFPRYLFVRLPGSRETEWDQVRRQSYDAARYAPGVANDPPLPPTSTSESEIQAMVDRADSQGVLRPSVATVSRGAQGTINVFGLDAPIIEDKPRYMVVELTMFGQQQRVRIAK